MIVTRTPDGTIEVAIYQSFNGDVVIAISRAGTCLELMVIEPDELPGTLTELLLPCPMQAPAMKGK